MADLPIPDPTQAILARLRLELVEAPEFGRYKELVARAVDAFGDEIKASRWLSLPNPDLDGKTPLEAAQVSGYDAQALEPILIRLEHGIDY